MSISTAPRLRNVHERLSDDGHCASSIKGSYDYYHYAQDSDVHDIGWACAYRSGQTILSWYQYQSGNITSMVPTIGDIQQKLSCLDPLQCSQIQNSTQWIGSYELCLLVDYYYQAKCKIERVVYETQQSFLQNIVPILNQHFTVHGSPVMVGGTQGGGAIIILGVTAKDDQEVQFLFLDPHYISGQSRDNFDVEKEYNNIVDKKGCFWGGAQDYFHPNVAYNFLLPQGLGTIEEEKHDIVSWTDEEVVEISWLG